MTELPCQVRRGCRPAPFQPIACIEMVGDGRACRQSVWSPMKGRRGACATGWSEFQNAAAPAGDRIGTPTSRAKPFA